MQSFRKQSAHATRRFAYSNKKIVLIPRISFKFRFKLNWKSVQMGKSVLSSKAEFCVRNFPAWVSLSSLNNLVKRFFLSFDNIILHVHVFLRFIFSSSYSTCVQCMYVCTVHVRCACSFIPIAISYLYSLSFYPFSIFLLQMHFSYLILYVRLFYSCNHNNKIKLKKKKKRRKEKQQKHREEANKWKKRQLWKRNREKD